MLRPLPQRPLLLLQQLLSLPPPRVARRVAQGDLVTEWLFRVSVRMTDGRPKQKQTPKITFEAEKSGRRPRAPSASLDTRHGADPGFFRSKKVRRDSCLETCLLKF